MKKYFLTLFGILFFVGVLYFSPFGKSADVEICDGQYFLLEMNYAQGNFEVLSKTVESGCYSRYGDSFDYTYNLISGETTLDGGSFDPSVLFIDNLEGGELVGGVSSVDSGIIYLKVPYYSDAENFAIFFEGNKIFETSVYDAGAKNCRVR